MAKKKTKSSQSKMPVTGYFYSGKLGREVWYPNLLTADLLYFFESFKHIVWYSEKVDTVRLEMDDGTIFTYTPHYIIHLSDGAKIIVECVHDSTIDDEDRLQQRTIVTAWARQNNYSFILVYEKELRAGFVLRNLIYLYRYAHIHVPIPKLQQIMSELRALGGKAAIWQLAERCKTENEGKLSYLPYILNSIFNHLINVDLNQKITNDSLIWIPSENDQLGIDTLI